MKALAVLVATLVLAGCGSSSESSETTPAAAPSMGQPAPGGGLTVQEAMDSELDGPLQVRGYLIERDGELRLCSAILESYPPQCGEPSLRVEGKELAPSEEPVSLLGEVEENVFRVSETSR
ncbi:MAG: hypothetical protein H0V45_06380 [Actinobacteria bacterium]|nr:hypothetical protein [Actinomycetota bacterium]